MTLSTNKCSNCGREDTLYAGVRYGKAYKDLCNKCVGGLGTAEFYKRADRQSQRRTFAKDIIQPSETEYIKAYGPDKAREAGWSEDSIRRFS